MSLLSIVTSVFDPLNCDLSNVTILAVDGKELNSPPSTRQSSSSMNVAVESKTVRYDVVPAFHPLFIFHAASEPLASKSTNDLESNLVVKF